MLQLLFAQQRETMDEVRLAYNHLTSLTDGRHGEGRGEEGEVLHEHAMLALSSLSLEPSARGRLERGLSAQLSREKSCEEEARGTQLAVKQILTVDRTISKLEK